jgi:molybdopterin converting factor subunit 1
MLITIRLFARLREIARASELRRNLPDDATARTAWDLLVSEFPQLGDYTTAVSCAVNEEYARITTTLKEGDEIAFLPPVSGGMSGMRDPDGLAQEGGRASGSGDHDGMLSNDRDRPCSTS